ncbi:hypothetical protein EC988_006419, partial [Linderina pennispora]
GEPMCLAFNKLPSKREYPDYYVEIKRPIALDMMKSKITKGAYKAVEDFVADIDLMCSNAQQFNMPDSYIYNIAGEIRDRVREIAGIEIPQSVQATAELPATNDKSPTPHLKLTIRNPDSATPSNSATDNESTPAPGITLKLKRKRGSGMQPVDPAMRGKAPPAGSPESKELAATLDRLFQAIYDAELGEALTLLETPGLPINNSRPVVLKEPVEDADDDANFTWAPLHAASYYGRLKVAQVLCDKGADLEAVDTMHGSTPLAWSAYTGRKRLAKCLVRVYRANVNARNTHGQLPIEIVLDPENPKWAEFLMPTDGSKVDLPTPIPEAAAPVTETRKASARKSKSRSVGVDAASPQAMSVDSPMHTPKPSSRRGTVQPSLGPAELSVAHAQHLQSAQPVQTPASPAPGQQQVPPFIGGFGYTEVTHPQMKEAMKEIVDAVINFKNEDGDTISEP